MFCVNSGRIDLDADEGRNVACATAQLFRLGFRNVQRRRARAAMGDFTGGCPGPAPDYIYACRGISIIAGRQMEVQCDATIQATTIRPDTSTIVRPWVSSHRRAWRRVLRMLGDENRLVSRPARPPRVWRITPPWRE
jgi:hypothetical protein